MTPEQFGLMIPADFYLAWEYYLRERNRKDELMMEVARGVAARILGPFVKGGIHDVRKFWPMPFDKAGDEAPVLLSGDELQASLDNIKLIADQWLKD